ncbi:outer membrane channel protein [compost metagenome]
MQVTRGKYYPTLSMAYNINTLYGNNYEQLLSSTPGGLAPTSFVTQSGEAVFAQTVDREFGTTPFKDQFKNNRGSMLSFTLQIPIFNGLQVRNSTSKAKISYQNAIATEELTKNTLNKTIAQAVADLRAAEKKNVSAQSSYESLKKAYEYSQKRFDVGLINSLDLNIAKTNYSKAESEALQAKYDMIFKSKVIDYYLGKPLTL